MYGTPAARCSSSVSVTPKSKLNSPPSDDAHGNVHPIRRLKAPIASSGAYETAIRVTSWLARWTTEPLKPSAIAEHDGQPAVYSGPHMKWYIMSWERPANRSASDASPASVWNR